MMKRYFMALAAGLMTLGATAQTYTVVQDVTSKLTNADFKADTPVAGTVTTYDYNHTDVALGEFCLFGQQAVTGWTSNYPSDNIKQLSNDKDPAREDGANACAAGVFAYSTDGRRFRQAGETFALKEGKWIGAKLGFFAASAPQPGNRGWLDVDWLRVEK